MSTNPLSNYFRRPSIYITLPSKGQGYPVGSLEIPENFEFPVFPMTASDEISYKTPDALFNGQSIVDVIQSCVPNIKNAWELKSVDLDTVLISIRLATSGHQMDIDTTCPECENADRYGVDLRLILEGLKTPDYNKVISIGDLQFKFKPLNFKEINENNLSQFEEQKMYAYTVSADLSEEEKIKLIGEAFKKISKLTLNAIINTIEYIETPDTTVHDKEHIAEFIFNCDKNVFNKLKEEVTGIRRKAELKPLQIECKECGHKYEQPFTINMTDFFG